MGRDPFRIIGGSRRNSGVRFINGRFGLRCARLLEFAGLSSLALLREVGRNPDGVEKVHNTGEASQKEEIEEDAVCKSQLRMATEDCDSLTFAGQR